MPRLVSSTGKDATTEDKMMIDINSTEDYSIESSDLDYDDFRIISIYGNKPGLKFKPLPAIKNAWQTQNFLFMAKMQVDHDLKRIQEALNDAR